MTPNDLEEYLQVLERHPIGSAAIKLEDGCEIHVAYVPKLPDIKPGDDPTPGGWKSPHHLDNPADLRPPALDGEYKGELP